MISAELEGKLIAAVEQRAEAVWARAEGLWPQFQRVPLEITRIHGAVAGQAWYNGDRPTRIVLSWDYLLTNPKQMMEDTLPHEVAHAVARRLYGATIRPHGVEWQGIYLGLTGRMPERCHSFGKRDEALRRRVGQILRQGTK